MTRPVSSLTRSIASGIVLLAATVWAQESKVPARFEVASIKPNKDGLGGGIRSLPDGTLIATNVPIRSLLGSAHSSQSGEYRNLPAWADRERYDVTVRPPAGTSRLQTREMWQTLFRERMKLAVHVESREEDVYALVVARPDGRLGPELKPSPHDCAALGATPPPPTPPRTGLPSEEEILGTCGSLFGQGRIVSGGTTFDRLVVSLGGLAGRRVEDRTGLKGFYALRITFSPRPIAATGSPDPDEPPSFFTALEEQLGLKLEPARRVLETVVIDHIERPSEN